MKILRITSGTYKNLLLKVPESARPMMDRVKSSVFSIIQWDIENARILDMFAGSGALGIECLSRGAKYVTFIELSKEGADMIKENLNNCKVDESSYKVIQGNSLKYLASEDIASSTEKYDIAFVCPPHIKASDKAVEIATGYIITGGLIIAECPKEKTISLDLPSLEFLEKREYGRTHIYFYRKI